ncbi:MAG: PEP-CTERM sorting domain-containing protein [Acidobacteriota bacterium]
MRSRFIALAALGLLVAPSVVEAGPIYFSTLSAGTVTNLGTGAVAIPGAHVTAQALKQNRTSGVWGPSTLIARNETDDHGLGVCSEGLANCNIGSTGGGDRNELSQLTTEEAILLSLEPGWNWSELWVSSLDSGDGAAGAVGQDGNEAGRVFWGNSSTITALLGGPSFGFQHSDFGGLEEGNILALSAAGAFDMTSRYVLFRPDGVLGANNDYLVYGAAVTPVPEPGTLTLVALGLAAAWRGARRRPTA